MTGLMYKDLEPVLQRKSILILFVIIALCFGMTQENSFVIGYLAMLFAILSTSTISYDEFDNGYPFLMTLPVTRKSYVIGKYIFVFGMELAAAVIGEIMMLVIGAVRKSGKVTLEILSGDAVALMVMIIMVDILLPALLKFGYEKGRLILVVIIGAVIAIALILYKTNTMNSDTLVNIERVSDAAFLLGALAVTVVCTVLSVLLSIRIMKKRQF